MRTLEELKVIANQKRGECEENESRLRNEIDSLREQLNSVEPRKHEAVANGNMVEYKGIEDEFRYCKERIEVLSDITIGFGVEEYNEFIRELMKSGSEEVANANGRILEHLHACMEIIDEVKELGRKAFDIAQIAASARERTIRNGETKGSYYQSYHGIVDHQINDMVRNAYEKLKHRLE